MNGLRFVLILSVSAILAANATAHAQGSPQTKPTPASTAAPSTIDPAGNPLRMTMIPSGTTASPATVSPAKAARTGTTQTKNRPTSQSGKTVPTGTPLTAKVIEIRGVVEKAPVGADPADANVWSPIAEGDRIGENVLIRTGMRSRCVLLFGEAPNQTVISVRRATLARISEFVRTSTEQRIKLGLGYGAIRGGSSEGTLRSDVVIDSTVATLAKRGTEGFELEVEPTTGRFNISLSRSGLVEAMSKLNNQRRSVRPGEYATNENIAKMWVNQDIFDRSVRFYESEALSKSDLNFIAKETTGMSSLGPSGRKLFNAAGRNPGAILNIIRNRRPQPNQRTLMLIQDGAVPRPEGSFGFGPTFRVLTPRFDRRAPSASVRHVRPTSTRRPGNRPLRRSRSSR
ncbi:MAG: hypothetical protein GXP29_08795 [Planctomycetes bacterium]|nr:hypothetical protein [Planctomycetota bacterium]